MGWVKRTAGGLPATFWYLWTGTVINRLGQFSMLFLEMSLVFRYHFPVSFAGLVLGLHGAGLAVGSMLGGALADAPRMVPFALNALALAAAGLLTLLRAPESRPALPPDTTGPRGGLGVVFRDRIFIGYVLLHALFWMIIETSRLLPVAMQRDGLPA